MINVPVHYRTVRSSLKYGEVSFGCGGLRLFDLSEIETAQVGYSVSRDGISLCGAEAGLWKPNWLVIGHDTALGDPLILDTGDSVLPVLTAMHGEGSWQPVIIASSLDAFVNSLKELSRIATGRPNPVEREQHPVSDEERNLFLERIAQLNRGEVDLDFWGAILEC